MIFKKEDLNFFNLYQACSDTREKVAIWIHFYAEGDKLYVSQYGSSVKLITVFDNPEQEKIDRFFLTTQLSSFIKNLKNDEMVEITSDTIKVNNTSEYKFSGEDFVHRSPIEYLNLVSEIESTYDIVDLQKVNKVKDFFSKQKEEYDTISLQSNYFVGYNGRNGVGAVQTQNNIEEVLYFPSEMIQIWQYFKIDFCKLGKLQDGQFYYFNFGNINVFIENKAYETPNIFDEEVKANYDHTTKLVIEKSKIKEALKRIFVLTRYNTDNRVYVKLGKDKVSFESRDLHKGYETIDAEVDEGIQNTEFILDSALIEKMITSLSGEKIYIYSSVGEDFTCIRVTDENNIDFYIHQIFKIVDFEG